MESCDCSMENISIDKDKPNVRSLKADAPKFELNDSSKYFNGLYKTKTRCNLHSAHPPNFSSKVVTIRMHRLVICFIGSTPATLPAATALTLCSTSFSLSNKVWQCLQYQVPLGTVDRNRHAAIQPKKKHKHVIQAQ